MSREGEEDQLDMDGSYKRGLHFQWRYGLQQSIMTQQNIADLPKDIGLFFNVIVALCHTKENTL